MIDKKSILTLSFVVLFFGVFAQKNIIEKTTKAAAGKIAGELKKRKEKKVIKVAVLNFTLNNGISDTVRTEIGSEISKKLEHYLANSKNKHLKVLKINMKIDKLMEFGCSDPEKINESDFLKKYLKGKTPDCYIYGNYEISEDYKTFSIKNIFIRFKNKTVSIKDKSKRLSDSDALYLISFETVQNIEQLSKRITLEVKCQTNILNINLSNFVDEKNKLPSEFSDDLSNHLVTELRKTGEYKIKQNITRGRSFFKNRKPHTLSGTYKKYGDKLKVHAVVTEDRTEKIIASANFLIPLKYLKTSFEPPKDIEKRLKVLNEKKIEKKKKKKKKDEKEEEFNININTNKGNENVVFKEDEIVQFTVVANKPCFLRFIYILADENAVLLLDNVEITKENINKPYKIKDAFYCCEPFGAETLILNAQTGVKFEKLNTNRKSGYTFIEDDLSEILENNRRGVKQVDHAEKIINFITIKK